MAPLLPPRVRASQRRRNVSASGPGIPPRPAAPPSAPPTPAAGSIFPEPVRPTAGTNGPLDPNYTARVGIADQRLTDTLSDLDYRETATRQHYGFDDPSDPFSVAKMLARNFEIARRGATNSYASRGQLYSGAAQRAQDLARFNNEQGIDQARRSYADVLQGITSGRAQAKTTRATSVADASSDSTIAALLNRPSPDQVPAKATPSAAERHRRRRNTQRYRR